MAIKPYLQLVRLPNVFTAAADSLAGWLLVMGSFEDPQRWGPLVLTSILVYAAGIALNDLFDYDLDRAERPFRPLPSGRVSRRFAAGLGVVLLGLGLALAAVSGSVVSLAIAGLLTTCVVAYDAGLKRTALGPELMGACRGLNVLLGMSQAPTLGGPAAWLVAGAMALFVVGVTWISRSETETGRSGGVMGGMILQEAALIGLLAAALQARAFPRAGTDRPIVPLVGLLVLALVALVVNLADSRAVLRPEPATVQRAVKTGVLALIWLHVGVVAAVRGPVPALAVAALWVPAFGLGRWLYST
ncbi:MAG: UbiA family prenyltransferase [Isosphaeraceae bacterium]|nr:UbiA family prenyltransferase [Isosphaeraceae bacterium]